jgi:hypothetical protein
MIEPIKITGLAEFNRNLRKINADLPKTLRLAQNKGAQLVVDWAKPKIPRKSGAAARTVKAKSTRTESRVTGGSARVAPYYPWLDFGGHVGPKRSVRRAYHSDGRYIYQGYYAQRDQVQDVLVDALLDVVRGAGVEVER